MNLRFLLGIVFLTTCSLYSQKEHTFYRLYAPEDSLILTNQEALNRQGLSHYNALHYFHVAEALWREQRNDEAEKMFREIMESELEEFNKNLQFDSDVSRDTLPKNYGYGSYSFHYKNKSSLYLAKILIERKAFQEALHYVTLADTTYPVTFNCGTGHGFYEQQLNELYALCYEGMAQSQKVMDLLLPNCLQRRDNTILVRVIRNRFTKEERKYLREKAIASIQFELNTEESYIEIVHNYGTKSERIEPLRFTTGTGTILLFGQQVRLPSPSLKNGQIAEREDFLNAFTASNFYKEVFQFWEVVVRY